MQVKTKMTTKQIEEVFLTEDVPSEDEVFDEAFQELKREQTVHLQEALSTFK